MLGAAGTGKTHELDLLHDHEAALGRDVRRERAASLMGAVGGVAGGLREFSDGATENTVVYLDALDELHVSTAENVNALHRWIERSLSMSRPRLRISCRSAVWPNAITQALQNVYGIHDLICAQLEPLDDEMIATAATVESVPADRFVEALRASRVVALARQPLLLRILIDLFKQCPGAAFPKTRVELFELATQHMLRETEDRQERRTAYPISYADLRHAAEHVACVLLMSGHDRFAGVGMVGDMNGGGNLVGQVCPAGVLTERHFDALKLSGLCERDPEGKVAFVHRLFMEFLAARRLLDLPRHQCKALLRSAAPGGGIAGSLRETAAFAASLSGDPWIARWILDEDPLVFAISDVADPTLRREAFFVLLDRFKRSSLTDAQIHAGSLRLEVLHYDGVEADLKDVLKHRSDANLFVLAFVLTCIDTWEIRSLSADVADVMLDPSMPYSARTTAGYTLRKVGSDADRIRSLEVFRNPTQDPDHQLRGLSLRCVWPRLITPQRLFDYLDSAGLPGYIGTYAGFLMELDRNKFNAKGATFAGLLWSKRVFGRVGDWDPAMRIAMRIAHAALEELDDPDIRRTLAEILVGLGLTHANSPLANIPASSGVPETPAPLPGRLRERRLLLNEMAEVAAEKPDRLAMIADDTPGLLVDDDFEWLLQQALDESRSGRERVGYATLAHSLFTFAFSPPQLAAWLDVRDKDPIKTVFVYEESVELDSERARHEKLRHDQWIERSRPKPPVLLDPPPSTRIEIVLNNCETEDARWFDSLCQEMSLEPDSTHYHTSRLLASTPGWKASSDHQRIRILNAAKRLLTEDVESRERAASAPFNQMFPAPMAALWLLMSEDEAWLHAQDQSWWRDWSWFIVRELHVGLLDEPNDIKRKTLAMLCSKAPETYLALIDRMATSRGEHDVWLFEFVLSSVPQAVLAEAQDILRRALENDHIPMDQVTIAFAFLLEHPDRVSIDLCLSVLRRLVTAEIAPKDSPAVVLAAQLLLAGDLKVWDQVIEMAERSRDFARPVLARYCDHRLNQACDVQDVFVGTLDIPRVARLAHLLFACFPPDQDRPWKGVRPIGPDDRARDVRNHLLSVLTEDASDVAIDALRDIEANYGQQRAWLSRFRSQAEMKHGANSWNPLSVDEAGLILANADARVVRSAADVVETILDAFGDYGASIHGHESFKLRNHWNDHKSEDATPKDEEHQSDILADVIRACFKDRALGITRETQVRRRQLATALGGKPGSEVDVLVTVPAAGSADGREIRVPIEVKLARNPEAVSGLRQQLVDRYMAQAQAHAGIYVVVWAVLPGDKTQPCWSSIDEARRDLELQAAARSISGLCVRAFVLDCAPR